mgnify:CR=1 FL=1
MSIYSPEKPELLEAHVEESMDQSDVHLEISSQTAKVGQKRKNVQPVILYSPETQLQENCGYRSGSQCAGPVSLDFDPRDGYNKDVAAAVEAGLLEPFNIDSANASKAEWSDNQIIVDRWTPEI